MAEHHEDNNATGKLIRKLRKLCGMTQSDLAERVGISYQQVQKYEYGTSEITLSRLKALADALGVSAGLFLYGDASGADGPTALSEDELTLVHAYRKYRGLPLQIVVSELAGRH